MARPTKKRRTPRNAAKVDEKGVLDLPLDVIIQVFQFLEPVDILHLARTTKNLRAFLLDRHRSRHVWKTAFDNVAGFPPCPDYVSEPAYAYLAFVPECHRCFKYHDSILWELRMRCCTTCLPEMTITYSSVNTLETSADDIVSIADSVRLPVSLARNGSYYLACHRSSDWENLSTRVENMTCPIESFVANEKMFWNPMNEHATLCRKWHSAYLRAETNRIEHVRQQRAKEIETHLRALGWTDRIYYSTCFLELPVIKKPEPLTSTEWSEISSQVIASLPKVRREQTAEIYRNRFYEFGKMLSYSNEYRYLRARPRDIDLLLLPPIRNILEGNLTTSMDIRTMEQKIGPSLLISLMHQWSNDAVDTLAVFAKQQLGLKSSVDHHNAVFTCTVCQRTSHQWSMDFDTALSHEHLYPKKKFKRKRYARMEETKIYEEVAEELESLRCLKVLQINKSASRDVDRLSKSLGCQFSFIPNKST